MKTILRVSSINIIKTDKGKQKVISFLIEQGDVDANHPSGEETYYDLQGDDGKIHHVSMVEIYCKPQAVSGKEGTYISFYFPVQEDSIEKGNKLTLI